MALPNHIAVVGGGRMGAGIALSFAVGGSQVTVLERDAASVDAARHLADMVCALLPPNSQGNGDERKAA